MANLSAYTSPGCAYPSFISVNQTDDDTVEVIVRSEAKEGQCGAIASIKLPVSLFLSIFRTAIQEIT
jgi:hypothetical protein